MFLLADCFINLVCFMFVFVQWCIFPSAFTRVFNFIKGHQNIAVKSVALYHIPAKKTNNQH